VEIDFTLKKHPSFLGKIACLQSMECAFAKEDAFDVNWSRTVL